MKFFLLSSLLYLLLSGLVFAEKYALLIGISEYQYLPRLAGPINDVTSLNQLLQKKWGFKAKNITRLENNQATKQKMVQALKKISQKLTKKDYFVFYYSGHGTSRYDQCNNTHIPYESGGIVPVDAKDEQDLFITRNDLRPYIEKMDQKGVQGLGLIDACFSGNSYRDLTLTNFSYRYAKLRQITRLSCSDHQTRSEGYPYQNFVFMTAAPVDEKALDLDKYLIKYSYQNMAHGAFSSALLKALDKSKQGIDYETLFADIQQDMEAIPSINHSPLLFPEDDAHYYKNNALIPAQKLYAKAIFGTQVIPVIQPKVKSINNLLINIPLTYPSLRKAVQETTGLALAQKNQLADLMVIRKQGKYQLTDIYQTPLYITNILSNMKDSLQQQGWINKIKKAKNPLQPFNLRITTRRYKGNEYNNELSPECKIQRFKRRNILNNETFIECDILNIQVKLRQKSYIAIFNLRSDGAFKLLYPLSKKEEELINNIEFSNIIEPPFGTDTIITMAFTRKHDLLYQKILKEWQNNPTTLIEPDNLFHQQLLNFLTTPSRFHAQHIKSIITLSKK